MDIKLQRLLLFKKMKFNFEGLMQKHNLKIDTLNESDIQRNCTCLKYPRDSKIYSDEGFVIIDVGSMRGTPWTCFYSKR